jgi:hypothetical protein
MVPVLGREDVLDQVIAVGVLHLLQAFAYQPDVGAVGLLDAIAVGEESAP